MGIHLRIIQCSMGFSRKIPQQSRQEIDFHLIMLNALN